MFLDSDNMFVPFSSTATMSTPVSSLLFTNALETIDWLNCGSDQALDPLFLPIDAPLHSIKDLWLDQESLKIPTQPLTSQLTPTSMVDQSAVAELYSRSHSPAMDKDAVEPREYVPVSIELDAQLNFPDMSYLTAEDVDHENLAQVEDIPEDVRESIAHAAQEMQKGSSFPRFKHLVIPPTPVLNAWVQLYFEYFHPVMPILHKSGFC